MMKIRRDQSWRDMELDEETIWLIWFLWCNEGRNRSPAMVIVAHIILRIVFGQGHCYMAHAGQILNCWNGMNCGGPTHCYTCAMGQGHFFRYSEVVQEVLRINDAVTNGQRQVAPNARLCGRKCKEEYEDTVRAIGQRHKKACMLRRKDLGSEPKDEVPLFSYMDNKHERDWRGRYGISQAPPVL